MGRRLRDSQRSKVYKAERMGFKDLNESRRNVGITEAQEVLDILVAEFETSRVTIKLNRRIKAWGGWYQRWRKTIEVPRASVPISTVLHEFAHHLSDEREVGEEGHGGGYTEAMLDVVEAWMSPTIREGLAKAYTAQGCKVGGHHVKKKLNAYQERRERDGERRTVYVLRWNDTAYMKNLNGRTTWNIEDARVYLTLKGAKKAATEHGFDVYSVQGFYSAYYDKYLPTYGARDLTLEWECVQ